MGAALAGTVTLIWYRPSGFPAWGVWGALTAELAAHALTATTWGPWEAKLSCDPLGPYLTKILSTHWLRTALVTAYATVLLASTLRLAALR